jgi:CubicO group peptidase (beta-lactamase class C family)
MYPCAANLCRLSSASLIGRAKPRRLFSNSLRRRKTPGLGFEIAAKEDGHANYRSPGSLSWAGLFNTEFWIDPRRHVAGVMLMQLLPFYDDGAIRTLRDFEQIVYQHLN